MTTYTIAPYKDKMWQVQANGRRVSKHRTKRKAKKRARELADRTDSITVRGQNGKFQKQLR